MYNLFDYSAHPLVDKRDTCQQDGRGSDRRGGDFDLVMGCVRVLHRWHHRGLLNRNTGRENGQVRPQLNQP